jgi:hypothetical protein
MVLAPARAHQIAEQALQVAERVHRPQFYARVLDRVDLADQQYFHNSMASFHRYVSQLAPGEDDDVISLLAEANARCGIFFDVDLTSYALTRPRLQKLVSDCIASPWIQRICDRYGHMEYMMDAHRDLMHANVRQAVSSAFLKQGLVEAAKWLLPDGPAWDNALVRWGPYPEIEQKANDSASRWWLAWLAWRTAPRDPDAATLLATKAEQSSLPDFE